MIYDVFYKTFIGAKPLCIMFGKEDWFIGFYDGTKYLVLFAPEKNDAIFNRIRYLTGLKSCVRHVDSFNFADIKIDPDKGFPLQKILTIYNVVILIKSAFNLHYYKKFLEKCSFQLPKK